MPRILRVAGLISLALTCCAVSCVTRRSPNSFQVIPRTPAYLLRSPDSLQTSFPEILKRYNGSEPASGWMDLHPQMELRIENAYYRDGMSRRGLAGFLGTETARYMVESNGGLRLRVKQSMDDRPAGQLPVEKLLPGAQKKYRYHRFYYEILFTRRTRTQGSVILGADSTDELHRLAAQLVNPESVCDGQSPHCTVFPDACSVSIEMQVVVNGKPRDILWGSPLANVATSPRHLALLRLYAGRLLPVNIDPRDLNALQIPLLPGDHIDWN